MGPPTLAGAGALRSNVLDMLTFLDANLGEPETSLEEAMRVSHEPRVAAGPGAMIGLNWITRTGGERTIVWHNGGTGGYRSFIGFDPDREVGVVVLTNSNEGSDDIGFHLLDPSLPSRSRRHPLWSEPKSMWTGGFFRSVSGFTNWRPGSRSR